MDIKRYVNTKMEDMKNVKNGLIVNTGFIRAQLALEAEMKKALRRGILTESELLEYVRTKNQEAVKQGKLSQKRANEKLDFETAMVKRVAREVQA